VSQQIPTSRIEVETVRGTDLNLGAVDLEELLELALRPG